MTYPLSTEVTAGQPTACDHYNKLRRDALRLGNADADSLTLAGFLNRHFEHMNLQYLATNRLRVPYAINQPPTLMINGCLLQATANVDLPSNQFTGVAATWYIFAVRSAGSTTFTLAVNTAAAEATDQRLIGECYWDGSNVVTLSIKCYFQPVLSLSNADYDSGWFAATYAATYTKAHAMGAFPRLVVLYHATDAVGTSEWVPVQVVQNGNEVRPIIGWDSTYIYITTGQNGAYSATLYSMRRSSVSGYYRLLAWR
jgi:hypothetical protein